MLEEDNADEFMASKRTSLNFRTLGHNAGLRWRVQCRRVVRKNGVLEWLVRGVCPVMLLGVGRKKWVVFSTPLPKDDQMSTTSEEPRRLEPKHILSGMI